MAADQLRRLASRTRRSSRGFSMIESIVALAIAAGVISAYFKAISTSLDLERRTRARVDAARIAHDLIDQIGFEIPLEPGTASSGSTGSLSWQIRIATGAGLIASDGQAAPSTAGLRQIEIDVTGPELPSGFRLVTLRVAGQVLR
jgi:prepilin-type N-terminal cleavage/methylation domain-containing protein